MGSIIGPRIIRILEKELLRTVVVAKGSDLHIKCAKHTFIHADVYIYCVDLEVPEAMFCCVFR